MTEELIHKLKGIRNCDDVNVWCGVSHTEEIVISTYWGASNCAACEEAFATMMRCVINDI